jgi:phosphatidylglycerophosphate synthase
MLIVLLCKGQGVDSEELSSFNQEKVADISLFERTLINLGSAGYNEAILICESDALPLKQLSERHPGFRIRAEASLNNLPQEQDLLIIQNNVVINKKQLANLFETIEDENGSFVAHNSENKDLGMLFLKEKDQEAFDSRSINLIQLKELLKKKILMDPPKKITLSEIGTSASSDFLFNHISKNVSGWISKNINSKISIPISKILVKINSNPNWVTFFVGCIGISCGFFYASNLPLIGALVLQLSTILDRCDGEVARIRLKESKFGQWFDTALDQLSYFSMFLGISMCINNPKFFAVNSEIIILRQISILNILLYIIFLTTILFFMIRRTKNGSLAYYPSEIDKITSIERRSFFYRLMAKFRFLLKREYFCPGMILVALIGYEFATIASFTLLFFGLTHLVSDFLEVRKKIDITY